MGLIKEPKNVDFYFIDESWSEKEPGEFSELIKQRKQLKKARQRKATRAKKRANQTQKFL